MKVFSILLVAILGSALTVFAAPGAAPDAKPAPKPVARPKPFPGELAMVEARAVFEGTRAIGPDGSTGGGHELETINAIDDGPDSVPPVPKVSLNKRGIKNIFKRQSCPWNHWYCSEINGCCQRSPEYRCCDFGCCPPGYYCCGWDGDCYRSWTC